MAPTDRPRPLDLTRLLEESPQRLSWQQALRLLTRHGATGEAFHLVSSRDEAFPPGDILRCHQEPSGCRIFEVAGLALSGSSGPLPAGWPGEAPSRQITAILQVMADLAVHHLGLLHHAIWCHARAWAQRERAAAPSRGTLAHLTDLARPWSLAQALEVPLLFHRPLGAEALRRVVQGFTRTPVTLLPFQPIWKAPPLPPLGLGRLGIDQVIGPRIQDRESGLRFLLGPIDEQEIHTTLPALRPGGHLHEALHTLLGPSLTWRTDVLVAPTGATVLGQGLASLGFGACLASGGIPPNTALVKGGWQPLAQINEQPIFSAS